MTLSPSDSTPDLDALLAHSSWVRQLARAIAATPDQADDVEQEAWRIALERPPKHSGNLKAWWTRVVHTTLHSRGRSETRHQNRVDRARQLAPEAGAPAAAELAEQMEDTEWLARVVNELPSILGETLYLRYYQDLTVAEIALQLGIAQTAVKSRLRRGLADLRSRFQTRHGDNWRARCLALAAPPQAAVTSVSLISLLLMNYAFRISALVVTIAFLAFVILDDGGSNGLVVNQLGQAAAASDGPSKSNSPTATERTEDVGDRIITIEEGYDLIGKPDIVRDSRVRITIRNADDTPFAHQRLQLSGKPEHSLPQTEARTNGYGVIELPCISDPWDLRLRSIEPDSEHCVDFSESILAKPSGLTEIELVHPGTMALTVKVIDHREQPVSGLQVTYHGNSTDQRGWKLEQSFTTAGDGTFPLNAICGDAVMQLITAGGFQLVEHDKIELGTNRKQLVYRLPETRSVTLRTYQADGQPMNAESVTAASYMPFDHRSPMARELKTVDLGPLHANGSIVVEAPVDQEWPLRLHHKVHGEILLTLPPRVTEFDFRLGNGEPLFGRVVDADGQPIANAEVRAWALQPPSSANWALDVLYKYDLDQRRAFTDADGYFHIHRLPQTDDIFLAVAAEGMAYTARSGVIAPNQKGDLEIQMQSEEVIAGRLLDGRGEPIDGSRIRLTSDPIFGSNSPWIHVPHMFGRSIAITDANGYFEFRGLTTEMWTVSVAGPSSRFQPVSATVPGGRLDVELRLKPMDTAKLNLECMVADVDGNWVTSNVEASLYFAERIRDGVRSSGKSLATRTSVPQIVASDLEVDDYVLQISAPGFAPAFIQLPAIAGMHSELVTLSRATQAHIQLKRPEGKKLHQTTIRAYTPDGKLIPNSKKYAHNLVNGVADPGLYSNAYGWLTMHVPVTGGYFEIVAEKGTKPVRVDFGPEIANCDGENPFVIELDQ